MPATPGTTPHPNRRRAVPPLGPVSLASLRRALRSAAATADPTLPPDDRLADAAEALLDGPDPPAALRRLADLPAPWFARPLPPAAARMLHEGTYPARLLAACPEAHEDLSAPTAPIPGSADFERWYDTYRAQRDEQAAVAAVRHRAYLAAARLEVEGARCEQVGGLLSDLAGFVLAKTLGPAVLDRVAVFGMGKLGGRELNFLSDIDLVFVHEAGTDVEPLHRAIRRALASIERPAEGPPLFVVDLRLRPFGRRGPLSMSADATLSYYETHGQPWERQAWLRARPVAGRDDLARRTLDGLRPFVFRRSLSPAVIAEIEQLMTIARRQARATAASAGGDLDLKHDRGGIREIEFFVQALLLLHAGRAPSLRTTSTFEALDRLAATGRLTERARDEMEAAYRFLRRLEHRVQLAAGVPTHRLVADPDERARLARSLFGTRAATAGRLVETLAAHMRKAAEIAGDLFAPKTAPSSRARDVGLVADPAAPRGERVEALRRLGLCDPEGAASVLDALFGRARSPFRTPGPERVGATVLLSAVLDSSDPDTALERLEAFCRRRHPFDPVFRWLASPEEAAREAARVTAEILATSEPLARAFTDPPPGPWLRAAGDPVEQLVEALAAPVLPDRADIEAFEAGLRSAVPDVHTRVFRTKQRFVLQAALADLATRPHPDTVGRALSDVADLAIERLAGALHVDGPLRLCVFGLGKLGDRAMDYGSDLDLLFVYTGDRTPPEAARRTAERAARALVRALEDPRMGAPLYRTDLRLRPSGRFGLLVTELDGFARHHARPRPLWERLPLFHLRPIVEICADRAGPCRPVPLDTAEVAATITARHVPAALWRFPRDRGQAIEELDHVLLRIWREIARETPRRIHLKAGPGGLLHLELAVDTLALVGGIRRIEGPSTMTSRLSVLAQAGVLTPAECTRLQAAYTFLRRVQMRLRLGRVSGLRDPEALDLESPVVARLARRMGGIGPEALVQRLHQERATISRILARHLTRS